MQNNLKKLKNELKISFDKLEKYCDITNSTLVYLSNENRPFRQVHIEKLSSFFNVTADYLLGKSDTGYIVFGENNMDPIILSESEYDKLKDKINIEIIQTADKNSSFTLAGKTIYFPKYSVHRELKGDYSQYDLKTNLIRRIDDLLKTCNDSELNLITKFIEEFIKKKK